MDALCANAAIILIGTITRCTRVHADVRHILTLSLPLHPLAASLGLDDDDDSRISILMLVTRVVLPFGERIRSYS